MAKYKRRNKLIAPGFQLKLVLIFLTCGLVGVLLQTVLLGRALGQLAERVPGSELELLEHAPELILQNLALTMVVMVPLFVVIGVMVTFRIAGPLFAIERYLRNFAAGKDVGDCRIRKSDEFHSLCDAVNLSVTAMRSSDEESQANEIESAA